MVLNLKLFSFARFFKLGTFQGTDLKYVNSFFSNFGPKISKKKAIFVSMLKFFLLDETLHFEKLESIDFKSDNSFSQNYLNNAFLIPNLIFFLHEIYYFDKFKGANLNKTIVLVNSSLNICLK